MIPETNAMEDPSSQGDEALDFRTSILRTAIAQQCISVGWHSISESSLAALTDVMDRYLRQLSHKIAGFTHFAGRTEADVGDFRLAINEIQRGVSLKNLRNFCTSLVEEPLMIEIDVNPSETAILTETEQEQIPDKIVENGEKTSSHSSSDEVDSATVVRPDWMDEDIIFPPIEPEHNVQETEKVLKEDLRLSANVADVIIIADDDEDIDEPVSNNSVASGSGRASPSKAVLSTQTAWPRQLKSVSFVNGTLFHPQDYALPMARMPVTTPKKPKHDPRGVVTPKKKKDASAESRTEKAITEESAKPAKKPRNAPKRSVESKPLETNNPNVDELKITIRPPKPKKPKIEPQSPADNTPSTDIPKPVFPVEKHFPKEPEFIPRIPSHPVLLPPVEAVPPPPPKVMLKFKSVPVLINKKDKNVGEKRKGGERTVGTEERKFKEESVGPRIEKIKRRKVEEEPHAADRERPPKQKKLTDTIDYLHQRTQDNGNQPSAAAVSVIVSNRPPQTAPTPPPVPTPAPYTPQSKKVKIEERYDPERERLGELERHEARMRQKAEERYRMEQDDLRRKEEQYRLEQDRIMAEKRARKMEERKAREAESLWNQKGYDEPPKSKSGKHKEAYIPERDSKSSRKETAAHPPLPKITLKMGSGKDIQVVKSSNPPPSQPFHAPLTLPRYPPQPLFDKSTSLSLPENLSFNPPVYPSNSSVAAPLDLSMKTPTKKTSLPSAPKPQAAQPPVDQKPAKQVTSQSVPSSKPIKAVLPMVQQPPPHPKKVKDEPVKPLPTPPPPPPPVTEPEALPLPPGDLRVWICPSCGKPDDGSPMVGCDDCDDWFHWTCVGLLSEPTVEQWYCPRCLNRRTSKGSKSKKGRKH